MFGKVARAGSLCLNFSRNYFSIFPDYYLNMYTYSYFHAVGGIETKRINSFH
jgi:hypothetical protein